MGILKKGFTLVVIPQKTSRIIQVNVPQVAFILGAALLALFVAVGGYGVVRVAQLKAKTRAFNELQSEYLNQKVAIRKIANQVTEFRTQFNRLRELDFKLRIITDLEVEQPSPSVYGMGGAVDNPDEALADSRQLNDMELLAILDKDLSNLEEMAAYQEESFNNLKAFLMDQKDLISHSPYRMPIRGFVSSVYGPRYDPFTGLQRLHEGIDIVARTGTVVHAPADGIVTFSGLDPTFGNMLVVDHGYGIITRYGHNDAILVREGQRVNRGMPISTVGSTGRSTGPHLHYEIRINDVAINPDNYMIR
ncbi:MAG: M23 family metallopeptidase [Candidatus Lambdaproteobacteria bacterium]|nr:M23 family metallopeptidase [Candidatus Lambdaproteobacteria bacterium]